MARLRQEGKGRFKGRGGWTRYPDAGDAGDGDRYTSVMDIESIMHTVWFNLPHMTDFKH